MDNDSNVKPNLFDLYNLIYMAVLYALYNLRFQNAETAIKAGTIENELNFGLTSSRNSPVQRVRTTRTRMFHLRCDLVHRHVARERNSNVHRAMRDLTILAPARVRKTYAS